MRRSPWGVSKNTSLAFLTRMLMANTGSFYTLILICTIKSLRTRIEEITGDQLSALTNFLAHPTTSILFSFFSKRKLTPFRNGIRQASIARLHTSYRPIKKIPTFKVEPHASESVRSGGGLLGSSRLRQFFLSVCSEVSAQSIFFFSV